MLIFFMLFLSVQSFSNIDIPISRYVHFIQTGEEIDIGNDGNFHKFCYSGKTKSLTNLWQSVHFEILQSNNKFNYFVGSTPEIVNGEYEQQRRGWSLNYFFFMKQNRIAVDPFEQSCIGIDTQASYKVRLNVLRVDYWKLLNLVVGITLFFSSQKLSRNHVFYYICCVLFGISASFLILIYFISRLFPKKAMMYGVISCGWTVGIYILQMLWENIRIIILDYKGFVAWYIAITGLISFIFAYIWGPLKNERTKNLIRWGLEMIGLFQVFMSTSYQEAAIAVMLFISAYKYFPTSLLVRYKRFWYRKFPPKINLLTNDQYYEQGVRETAKALDELRQYCTSPDCNQWKTALKLKDVKRFASFIEGNSHLSDDEILEYETSIQQGDMTDDEDEYTDED